MKDRCVAVLVFALFAAGCNRSPGPLEGEWRAAGAMPMTIVFRPGETEAFGVTEHVGYAVSGDTVEVTYKDGLMKGSSIKFKMVNQNTAVNSMYTLHKVR
jgi:hypothetical protein